MPKKIDSTTLEQLINDLRAAHGDNLASVVLYGSVAAGDHTETRSDHNLLIALNRITAEDLRQAQPPLREWQDLGQPIPVYFTVAELKDGADVFPIEFLQMERARKVLYGRDPFEFVEVSRANLRHQTEYELRTKLLRLRRLYISASASVEKLSALMSDSLASFAALFRAVLILLGQEPPIRKADSIHATVRLLELDGAPFERILELRTGKESPLTTLDANNLFSAYMAQIERVIDAVDRIESNQVKQ
jgi:predicted nucleotidyltransferase